MNFHPRTLQRVERARCEFQQAWSRPAAARLDELAGALASAVEAMGGDFGVACRGADPAASHQILRALISLERQQSELEHAVAHGQRTVSLARADRLLRTMTACSAMMKVAGLGHGVDGVQADSAGVDVAPVVPVSVDVQLDARASRRS